MAYPTTAELVAASNVAELTDLTEPQQDALRVVAIHNIERYAGQKFEPFAGTMKLDGSGGGELWPERRVEELTAISVTGTAIDLTDVVVSPDGDRLFLAPLSTDYAVQAMREEAYDSRTFRAGAGTVVVTGTFGWSEVPAPVIQAIRIEMEEQAQADASAIAGPVASWRRLGLRDISQGNLRASLGDPSLISPRAAALLQPDYVWQGPAGYVA
jgi:hypothetical protein